MTWRDLETAEPELAAFGRSRLLAPPAYLATVRADGSPRVHPVTPIIGEGRLFLFMEPTSPKGRDLQERGVYAMHNGVPDTHGTGGEFFIRGRAVLLQSAEDRQAAVAVSSYEPAERYVLFELIVDEARCNGYGDVELPPRTRWRAGSASAAG